MKAHLLFADRDLNMAAEPCFGSEALMADLGIECVLKAMAGEDRTIHDVCGAVLLNPLQKTEDVEYRQHNLRDAFANPDVVRQLYTITVETEARRKTSWSWLSAAYLSSTYSSAIDLLKLYTEMLMKLRRVADGNAFSSEGFSTLFALFRRELDDGYFAEVRALLNDLKDWNGMLISTVPGDDLQGTGYTLRRKNRKGFWRRWSLAPSFTIAARDDAGAEDLGRRRDRAINEATNALAQAADHLGSFFAMLRHELAFYVGCLNLSDALKAAGMPVCIPVLKPAAGRERAWAALYDVSLALTKNGPVVGNDLEAEAKNLYIVTGANQGGKSTFLRSLGQAQLMAQSGMPVGAERFAAPIRNGVFTHFKREEDQELKSGKLDKELARMDAIADHLQAGSLMLFNESFAATNEREGSEICRQITQALTENGVEVFAVTHLYTYAAAFLKDRFTQYLRAQRQPGGERTFRIVPGMPEKTAYGEDLYRRLFRAEPQAGAKRNAPPETAGA